MTGWLKRSWRWLAAAALIAALLLALSERYAPNLPADPIEVAISNERGGMTLLHVPWTYFEAGYVPGERAQRSLWLVAFLPGMLSERDAKKAGYPTVKLVGGDFPLRTDNAVLMHIGPSQPDGVKHWKEALTQPKPDIRFDGVRDDGFEVYMLLKQNYAGNYLPDPEQGEYLKPVGRDDVFVECPALDMSAQDVNCRVWTQFSDKLEIDFTLRRSRLLEWAAVEVKVRALVASFVVER